MPFIESLNESDKNRCSGMLIAKVCFKQKHIFVLKLRNSFTKLAAVVSDRDSNYAINKREFNQNFLDVNSEFKTLALMYSTFICN